MVFFFLNCTLYVVRRLFSNRESESLESDEEESSTFDDIHTATHDNSAANGVTNGRESDDAREAEPQARSEKYVPMRIM